MDEWEFGWHQLLAQKGYIVAATDTRGTGRKGSDFRKCTYGKLGALETEDLSDFADYLGSQSYIDGKRLGIWGWSYGGFMVANAMTRTPGKYALGIAVAPVTNWEYYVIWDYPPTTTKATSQTRQYRMPTNLKANFC